MNCFGRDASTGETVELTFNEHIESIAHTSAETDEYLAPGWIDLQVNGFAGVDYNDPQTSLETIAASMNALFATGVTRFYPTVITGPPDDMVACLRNLSHAKDTLENGEAIEGFHVEGPHISGEDGPRGAHPRHWVRKPDLDEFHRWQD